MSSRPRRALDRGQGRRAAGRRLLLGYTRVKAPYDGVVTRARREHRDYVTADGKHGLFAVARIDPVRVVVGVPEADAA
jgi:multidrug resistance efflux pump